MMKLVDYDINPALIVIDVQNGFVSRGGSYDLLGMNILPYQELIPRIRQLIKTCRIAKIPIFYTQAIREPSGIDLLTHTHKILPRSREERIRKKTICVRGTWDAKIVDDIKPDDKNDHIIIKRRDSAFHNTEIEVWLRSIGVDTLVFCGIDTSICVESSLRDAFNIGYDVILISDATASSNKKHYESTIEHVKDYYGLVMNIAEFSSQITQPQTIMRQT
ncbi:MAG TPA: isochorismatase family cysteine hydrolase [Nitrososphaeraceae archaeon]|nr:isochorismatase family cysteine hydrolase [Nitrososphaeraceae archaeon]HJY10680.1 isochorismatase family cysteine hydrolase [Nitrososphaeraceae archaeon]